MRTGFSTSACAAAAAVAALRQLLTGVVAEQISIDLPARKEATFVLINYPAQPDQTKCGVIKDAGDDPDVTNHLEIQAVVRKTETKEIVLLGGHGVGKVTLPGLPVSVGEAAINPGPRKLILQIFSKELQKYNTDSGYEITIQVPEGERVAAQTMNPKLGIVGGISILGTDGLVRPYSAPAFRTSLFYELRVARENGITAIGLATGKRSTVYLQAALKDTSGLGILDVGDELGYPIDQAVKMGFIKIIIGGMIGKLSKLAQGRFQTHVNEGEVDFGFLAKLSDEMGASKNRCDLIRNARTAHQVQNWLNDEGIALEPQLARLAAEQVSRRVEQNVSVAVWLFAMNGTLLGKSSVESSHVI